MTDYILTREIHRATGELPDKVTVVLPRPFAWWVVKQLILQLEQGKQVVDMDLLGTLGSSPTE